MRIFAVLLYLSLIIGEVKCVVNFFSCDFEPSYKAEIIYGGAVITGFGSIVGWFDFGK